MKTWIALSNEQKFEYVAGTFINQLAVVAGHYRELEFLLELGAVNIPEFGLAVFRRREVAINQNVEWLNTSIDCPGAASACFWASMGFISKFLKSPFLFDDLMQDRNIKLHRLKQNSTAVCGVAFFKYTTLGIIRRCLIMG